MGRLRRSRTHHARRDIQRAARTRVRTKDLDQIQHDMEHNRKKLELQPIDEDKPGLGQHVSGDDGHWQLWNAALLLVLDRVGWKWFSWRVLGLLV